MRRLLSALGFLLLLIALFSMFSRASSTPTWGWTLTMLPPFVSSRHAQSREQRPWS